MTPNFPIKQLSDLQDVDREILSRQKILTGVRAKLADNTAIQSLQQMLARVENELENQSSSRRRIESEIQRLSERLETIESRLYGGSVTNARELEAFQEEKAAHERQRSEEEDSLLEVMVRIEELQSTRNTAQERLDSLSAQREQDVAEWEKIDKQLSSELIELNGARDEVLEGIPPAPLSTYENLLRTRNGQAIAKVERGICQGCRITLPITIVQRARNASGPVQCTSCRRLLYVV